MERVWRSTSDRGTAALLHPESHFTEKKAALLRAETYRRLRRHWQFINELSLFEIHHLVSYGVHVYGRRREELSFKMAASLYHPDTVARSLVHDGSGEVPGLKDDEGNWDQRPHRERIIEVDESVLAVWADILDEPGSPPIQARMVYPVNRASSRVLEKLSKAPRVRELGLQYSSGWNETIDRQKGYFEVGSTVPASWDDVILQGPHFTVANPFAKQPNPTMKNNLDWTEIDLEALQGPFVPRTSYLRTRHSSDYDLAYGRWQKKNGEYVSVRKKFRLAVSEYIGSVTGRRSLQAALIPPGTAHINAVNAYGLPDEEGVQTLALIGGVFSALPADFLVKMRGQGHVTSDTVLSMPLVRSHKAASLIADRFLRLSDFWSEGATESFVRRESSRRRAMIELDALVALMFGLSAEELVTVYRTQFYVLRNTYEAREIYDAVGRKVPAELAVQYRQRGEDLTLAERTWTHPQSGAEYVFEFPFVSYDREEDMRKAYDYFEKLLTEKY
jgi:hypothetical protein